MEHRSDRLWDDVPGGAEPVSSAVVGVVLAGMAGHFATVRPGDLLTPVAVGAAMAGEIHLMVGSAAFGVGAAVRRAATVALPSPDFSGSRAGYAVLLEKAAGKFVGSAGEESDWSEDVNRRAIPTVPGPRRVPDAAPRPDVPGPRPSTGEAGR